MKKFWIVLLSVALIMAFAMPVCAADVKFSGSYVAQGYYENNRTLGKEVGTSLMNTWQRLRIQTDFQIQEGLKLTTKFDAMDKIWGASRNVGGTYWTTYTTSGVQNAASGESENIKVREAYVTFNIWGGALAVGYQQQNVWGTAFTDYGDYGYGARIKYTYVTGPWTLLALYDKVEGTQYYSSTGPAGNSGAFAYQVDNQTDKYSLAFIYNWGKGNTGLLLQNLIDSNNAGSAAINLNPATDTGFKRIWYAFIPYVKAQMGPLYVESEVVYLTGKTRKYETAGLGTDRTKDGLSAYVSGTYDFSPMYAGLTLAYVAGDDIGTSDKDESGFPGMTDFNPCLMLFNFDLARWNGNMGTMVQTPATGPATTGAAMSSGLANVQFLQAFVGMKPMPKLDVKASYTFAQADKNGGGNATESLAWVSKNYGTELDLTATYKIYDNLSYMVGFAYLWAGDFFKGTNSAATLDNDYFVTHKLTLTF